MLDLNYFCSRMKKWNFFETEIRIDSTKINWTSFREENCFLAAHANKFRFDFFFNDFYLLFVVSLADLTCDWLPSRPIRDSDDDSFLSVEPSFGIKTIKMWKSDKQTSKSSVPPSAPRIDLIGPFNRIILSSLSVLQISF